MYRYYIIYKTIVRRSVLDFQIRCVKNPPKKTINTLKKKRS